MSFDTYPMDNGWKLLVNKSHIKKCVKQLAKKIDTIFWGKKVVVVCILKGAVYFFVDLTRYLQIPHACYFIESSTYHDDQKPSETSVLGSIDPKKFADKEVHYVLVDELFDNGQTLHNIKTTIHEKASVPLDKIFTCTLFRKNKASKYAQPDLFGLSVPDVWLVGYGLDDKQEKRNWENVWACPKTIPALRTESDNLFSDLSYYTEVVDNLEEQIKKLG